MPHINHRRGDTRRRVKQYNGGYHVNIGWWNRAASRSLRATTHQKLRMLRAAGYPLDLCEDAVFALANEADNLWNYD